MKADTKVQAERTPSFMFRLVPEATFPFGLDLWVGGLHFGLSEEGLTPPVCLKPAMVQEGLSQRLFDLRLTGKARCFHKVLLG